MRLSALVWLSVLNVGAQPTVQPTFQQIEIPGSGALTCQFAVPLVDCRLRVSGHFDPFDAVVEFARGPQSPSVALRDNVRASYAGEGLQWGQCGVTLGVAQGENQVVLVECFGRLRDTGTWSRAHGVLTALSWHVMSVTSPPPPTILAVPGAEVAVTFKASDGRALDACYVWTPAAGEVGLGPGETLAAGSRYRVHGAGAARGECGASLGGVTQRDAGVWYWRGWRTDPYSYAWQATVLLSQAAPEGLPVLRVRGPSTVGGLLEASCLAPPSVPPARLSWYLGGRPVRDDAGNDTFLGDVAKSRPWDKQAAFQTLTRTLQAADSGKRLECRMRHEALPSGGRSVGHQLTLAVPSTAEPSTEEPSTEEPSTEEPSTEEPTTPWPRAASQGCPLLSSRSVHVRCSLSARPVDCVRTRASPGTTARLECRQGFQPRTLDTRCTEASRWQPSPMTCALDCGIRGNGAQALSVGGTEAAVSEFPWHVAVFRRTSDTSAVYRLICGGSLVTVKFFISAAHCFWDETNARAKDAALYRASLGKQSLPWNWTDAHEQRRRLQAVHIPPHYDGNTKRYEADIAVVQLSSPVSVTVSVNTVCVDWSREFEHQQLTSNSIGTVPGWGLTEENTLSPTLRYVDLPFVAYPECRAAVPEDFRGYLLQDKFCGGFRGRSTSVCQGDSGGGFVFAAQSRRAGKSRYFIRGVVSNSPVRRGAGRQLCETEHMTAFTAVAAYAEWMRGIVFAGSQRHP